MDPIVTPMIIGALGQGVGGLISSKLGADAASKAAAAQARAAQEALDFQKGVYNTAQTQFQPYIAAGQEGLQGYKEKVAGFKQPEFKFQKQDFNLSNWKDPGYEFRLGEAQKAIEASTAKKGMTLGSGALKALQTRGQEMASQEYEKAYDRYGKERAFDYGTAADEYARNLGFTKDELANLLTQTNIGRESVANLAGIGGTQGAQIGQSLTDRGNAAAMGILGPSSQWQNLFTGLGSLGQNLAGEMYKSSESDKNRELIKTLAGIK